MGKFQRFDLVGFRRTENKETKIRKFGHSCGLSKNRKNQVLFCVSGGLLKNRRIKIRSGGLLKNENPKILKFGWAFEERKPKDLFSWLLKIEGTKIRFGGLLKNKKELRFELWGFLSLFPSHLPSPLSFFPAISLSLTFVERFLEIFFSFSRFL
ncbi:unnamed protein product [Rhizophagus irregularis]|nr:unnamed protein product [Rhizophagus irregularis]